MKLKPFGDRVVVELTDEEYGGTLLLPEKRSKPFFIGTVIEVGDGTYSNGTVRPMFIKAGDIVMWQMDAHSFKNVNYVVDGHDTAWIMQDDILATLSSKTINMETVTMAGKWILVNAEFRAPKTIIVPETIQSVQEDLLDFFVSKIGGRVQLDIAVGDQVSATKSRITPMKLDDKLRGFVHENFIHGKFEPA